MERMNTAPKRVRTIPATVQPLNVYSTEYLLKRVAAYCRVSTKQEEQLNSLRNAGALLHGPHQPGTRLEAGGHLRR